MNIGQLSFADLHTQLSHSGVILDVGPYRFKIQTRNREVAHSLALIYGDYPIETEQQLFDFSVTVASPSSIRRWIKPQIQFFSNTERPFLAMPKQHAYAMLEWGMNWCISSSEYNDLLIHAAVLEKNGKAIVCPAPPGSGKSTLTAYFAYNGWRLLSDEIAIINMQTLEVKPSVRPICLKNQSITLVKSWFPDIPHTKPAKDTMKGDVSHFRPPQTSIEQRHQTAPICAFIFPAYRQGLDTEITQLTKTDLFNQILANSFNFSLLGETAFNAVTQLVEQCEGLSISYTDIADVEAFVSEEVL